MAIALIQARMGSSRLPGKTLMPLWQGHSVLEVLLTRLRRCRRLDGLVVATSTQDDDTAIEALCRALAVPCFRGDATDVLGRLAAASREYPACYYVRVCADNPLMAAEPLEALVDFCVARDLDFAHNNRAGSGLVDGFGAEVLSAGALRRLAQEASTPEEREHVTLHIMAHPERYRSGQLAADPDLRRPQYRLDVDYHEDLEFLRELCRRLSHERGPLWSALEIVSVLDADPDILALRRARPTTVASLGT